jgi:hypothetical protein
MTDRRVEESGKAAPVVRTETIVEFFRNSPLAGADIDLERQKDEGRDIRL